MIFLNEYGINLITIWIPVKSISEISYQTSKIIYFVIMNLHRKFKLLLL